MRNGLSAWFSAAFLFAHVAQAQPAAPPSATSGPEDEASRRAMYSELSLGTAGSPSGDEDGTTGTGFAVSGTILRRSSRRWALGLAGGMVRVPWDPPRDHPSGWAAMPWLGVIARVYAIDRAISDPYFQFGLVGTQVFTSPRSDQCGTPTAVAPQAGVGIDWYATDWAGVGLFAAATLPLLPLAGYLCSGSNEASSDRPSGPPVGVYWTAGGSIVFGAGE